jgi:hypothetical protein
LEDHEEQKSEVRSQKEKEYNMPLTKSSKPAAVTKNIREFHGGKTYAATLAKFGKARANKQAIAVALSTQRSARKKK